MIEVAARHGEIDWIKIPEADFDFLDFNEADRLIQVRIGIGAP